MMEIQKKALEQAQKASAEDWRQIFLAMRVVFEISDHAKHNGLLSLSMDESFRDGKPYILDTLEEKLDHLVPLRRYLSFGLECISSGADRVEKLMENRCSASSYAGMDLLTAWIYSVGVRWIQVAFEYSCMLKCLWSIIPDDAEDKFKVFIDRLMEDLPTIKRAMKRRPEICMDQIWDKLAWGAFNYNGIEINIRQDAMVHAQEAFEEDGRKIFFAMQATLEVLKYACKNGLEALQKDVDACNSQPYVLDLVEEKGCFAIPLKNFLFFGLECVAMGISEEETKKLLVNKYFVNGFVKTDAVIAYIYYSGIIGILRKADYSGLMVWFTSMVPDAGEEAFQRYLEKLDAGYSTLVWKPAHPCIEIET